MDTRFSKGIWILVFLSLWPWTSAEAGLFGMGRRMRGPRGGQPRPCCGPVQRVQQVQNNNAKVVNNNNNLDFTKDNEVKGFTNLLQSGNSILERASDRQVNRIILLDDGRVLGVRAQETVDQLKEFYLKNFNRLRSSDQNRVSRFLERQGVSPLQFNEGVFTVDLDAGTVPDDLHGLDAKEYRRRGLNFLLNSISQSPELLKVGKEKLGNKTIALDMAGRVPTDALVYALEGNPYACGSIKGNEPVRVD